MDDGTLNELEDIMELAVKSKAVFNRDDQVNLEIFGHAQVRRWGVYRKGGAESYGKPKFPAVAFEFRPSADAMAKAFKEAGCDVEVREVCFKFTIT